MPDTSRTRNRLKFSGTTVFLYLVMLFVFIISVFPVLWVVLSSFKDNSAILSSPFSLPERFDFNPFIQVFTQYNFGLYTINSLVIASVATIISLLIYSMGAYSIAKFRFPGKNLLYLLFTLTLLVPPHTKAQPIFSLITNLGLSDTRFALVFVYISFGMAITMFVMRISFMSIPDSLNEAAFIEGAGFWRVYWSIDLPLARTGLATSGIMMFLGNWNEYFYAMLLTSSPRVRTLPLALAFFTEAFSYDYTQMFAALTIVILPGIIMYIITQEQVQASVASTGVKG
ncbi:MAG: carbohydrate ABC transporter permease [Sphaerochaetaceae bacterium]|nr:carbohydrate ABC transporter permease [Sphaerochaetaceae bacterium]